MLRRGKTSCCWCGRTAAQAIALYIRPARSRAACSQVFHRQKCRAGHGWISSHHSRGPHFFIVKSGREHHHAEICIRAAQDACKPRRSRRDSQVKRSRKPARSLRNSHYIRPHRTGSPHPINFWAGLRSLVNAHVKRRSSSLRCVVRMCNVWLREFRERYRPYRPN